MSLSTMLFFLLTFIHLFTPNLAQLQGCTSRAEYCWSCSNIGNYSSNSIYQKKLYKLLLSFSSLDQNSLGFYNISSCRGSNKVNAIGLCRGGLAFDSCRSCLNVTSHMILERCPNTKEAILWGELCLVRYSNNSIFSIKEDEPIRTLASPNEAADAQQFKVVLKPLLDDLINKAASDVKKYAIGSEKVPNSEPIYALVQCTPDLTQRQCSDCLQDSSSKIPGCCAGRNGARVLKPSCTLRYESGPFYETTGPYNNGICTNTAEFCWNCFGVENGTSIHIFWRNLKKLLLSFSNDKTRSVYGFFNSSEGKNPYRVNAIALCRGDLSPENCRSCLSNSSQRLLGRCLNRREAIFWDERCMIRYSNKSILSTRQDDPRMYIPSPNKSWEPNLFKLTLKPLLDNITSKASSGDSLKKFATGQSTVPGFETIYAAAQCTPNLDKEECSGCLNEAILFVPQQFDGKQGGRVLKPSCNLRFEVTPFFDHTADSPVSPNSFNGENKTTLTVVAAVFMSVVMVVLIITVWIMLNLRKKPSEEFKTAKKISWVECWQFDIGTLREATDYFSEANKLGQGGFGAVYRNGQYIAVKTLSKTSGQGDEEFKNEVMLIAKLQHRNLVDLLGFCLDKNERYLFYEYVPNSSLERFMHDPIKCGGLDWDRRYKIIQGIVRGLAYLHEDSRLRIVHRNLKASNILLDEEMNPKISDFGMERLFVFDQTQGNASWIVTTHGYMAPEYALHGKFSFQSDVYSFGVLLLEMVSGEKNSCFHNEEADEGLLTYAWKNWSEGTTSNLIDPTISGGSKAEIMRCIHIGLLCVQENVADRPSMNSIIHMLNSHSISTLAVPSKPTFFMHSSFEPKMLLVSNTNSGETQSQDSKSDSSQGTENEAAITDLYPHCSQDEPLI
ncbi:cysteine-rich receptor-like protein kinase 26 [Humulus lupulus]|uniref:cysteine-rich receptor-like protein kinase 26 n=1 Tax=Humulus lupulus TaxID=3486 RepID=UPI002B402A36|nr:cysteine-rich receptor-like protein kinase 26 [Humulus lupulus]